MNPGSHAVPGSSVEAPPLAAGPAARTRPFYWSVRRELWEHSSIYVAPLITAGLVMLGFAISAIGLPERRRAVLLLDPVQQRARIEMPYDVALSMIMLTTMLVWLFYCLDTLYGERRDRSILFWKSLPVSDATTVLSKVFIPIVILPLLTFVITVATHSMMLLMSTVVLRTHGLDAAVSGGLPCVHSWPALLYGLVAMALWDAPMYAWLLLVSAWARRAALLWAALPPLSLVILERLVFQSGHVAAFFEYRAMGWATAAFAHAPRGSLLIDPLNPVAPEKFVRDAGLWLGLASAAVMLAAAVRIRRSGGPT